MAPPPPPPLPPPPPQAAIPPAKVNRRTSIPSMVFHERRRAGRPNINKQARAAPPNSYQGTPWRLGRVRTPLVGAVVLLIRVAAPGFELTIYTGPGAAKLNVGMYAAPAGLEVTAAMSTTVPVKPPTGVTVTVEPFAMVAPGVTVTAGANGNPSFSALEARVCVPRLLWHPIGVWRWKKEVYPPARRTGSQI